jgi:glutathione S-transferase
MLRLYTFTISHFSEKARWALDFAGIPYEERRLLPGAHVFTTRRLAPRTSVPVLQHDRTIIQGSTQILDYAEGPLGGAVLAAPPGLAERAKAIEAQADEAFGIGTQRIFYGVLLARREQLVDLWTQGGPRWGRAFYVLALPLLGRRLRQMYAIRPNAIEKAQDLYRRTFDELDRSLARSPYLLGDAPSRADLAVASLLAPLCRPPEHALRWPAAEEAASEVAAFVREFEGRPTWSFVLRMYRDHRRSQNPFS